VAKSKEEKIQKIKDWVKKNATRLFLTGMALLLVGRLYIWWNESNYTIPPDQTAMPIEIQKLTDTLDETKVEFTQVVKMITPLPDLTTTSYFALTQFNMFDPKSISGADGLIARTNPVVDQAQAAYAAKDIPGAKRLLAQALALNPNQKNGIKLRDEINAYVMKAQAAATSATATSATATK
jgi:predicted negative regulator of RcsB-dependent stress response